MTDCQIPTIALFPGQGSQQVGMGIDLVDTYEVAQVRFAEASEVLGIDLLELCRQGPEEQLRKTALAQPAILTVSTIYFDLLRGRYNIAIGAGHSLGEYSALVAADAITFTDAVGLVHRRGKLMQEAVPEGEGKMVAVLGKELELIETALRKVTAGVVDIANINAIGQVVISGEIAGVDEAIAHMGDGRYISLPVSAPFHSRLMTPAATKLAAHLDGITISPPSFPIIANISATPLTEPEAIRTSLKEQVCGRVRWVETIQNAMAITGLNAATEFGTGSTLAGLARRIDKSLKVECINSASVVAAAFSEAA